MSAGAVPNWEKSYAHHELGVYVHFPWCLKKCPYCDFLSIAAERQAVPHREYADAVTLELAARVRQLGGRRVRSIFFGGGTPSLWAPDELGRVLETIVTRFDVAPDLEVTVECNPTSFTPELARTLHRYGVNRVSIGVQSLNPERLAFLGRLHDVAGGLRAVEQALASEIARVSADLIFGVAGQSATEAADEVSRVAALGPTHVSAYALTIEPGTQFGALARKGKLPLLPEDTVADCFLAVSEALQSSGFEHYEISNFARAGHHAEHNLGYWKGRDYLGLGCGAWGTVTLDGVKRRYRNTPSAERYLAGARSDDELWEPGPERLVAESELITPEMAFNERLLLCLRLAEGFNVAQAGRELGIDPWTRERVRAVERLCAAGRLERDGDWLRIPRPQWLVADGTIAELL